MMLSTVWVELRLVLIVFLISLLVGYVSGYLVVSISVGLFSLIIWHLRQIIHLRLWLSSGASIETAPNLFGPVYQIVSQICDLKKKNYQEQANLERLLSRFDAATKAMPDAMLIIDQSQNIEWANPAAKILLGIDLFRDIGQRVDNIVRDPVIANYLSNAKFDEPLEFSSVRSSENDLALRVVTYDDGKKLLIVHDHRDLLKLQKVRKTFVSNASHEMRTPLTVIIGYLETLTMREEMSGSTRRGVDGALGQAQRLKQLIEDLLSLSRLESLPLSKSHIGKINIAAIVAESIEVLKQSDIFKQQRFELQLDEAIQINGVYRELQSAIQNLLDNAIKYSPVESQIKVNWEQLADGGLILSVHDQGEGIDDAHIPHLAERFYRVDDGRSRDMGGTGLGLSIVKHVMERHGGELRVRSSKEKGTTVELYFPIRTSL